jgi:hypothetical protein
MMEVVEPNRDLSRWKEFEVAKISPADVYRILKQWKDRGSFDDAHIAAISRDVARSLSDLLETPEGGTVVYHNYTETSYIDADKITEMYGDRIESYEEMRDGRGYLQQYRIILKPVKESD